MFITKGVKRLSMLIIVSVLIVAMLSACTIPQGSQVTNQPDASQNSENGKDVKDTVKEIPKIYIYQNSGVLNTGGSEAGSRDADMVKQYIIENAGVEPVVIIPPTGAEEEKLNLLLASGEKVDLFWKNWDQYTDIILPLNDLLNQYGQDILKTWPENAWTNVTDKNGNIMATPRNVHTVNYPIYVREDWLEKCNLSMPTTLDEFENVLATFKEKDPAGNGKTIPLIAMIKGLRIGLSAGFTGVGYDKFLDTDGKLKPVELMPEYKEFLMRMNDWYNKGYLYKEFAIIKTAQAVELIKQNQVGTWSDWYSRITLNQNALNANYPEANYEIAKVIGPKGPMETVNKSTTVGGCISRNCEDPVAVIKYINWTYANFDNWLVTRYGLEDVHWKYTDKANNVIEQINPDNVAYYGDFLVSHGLPLEQKMGSADPLMQKHQDYILNDVLDLDRAVQPLDLYVSYDKSVLEEEVPGLAAIDRMLEEGLIQFIVGERTFDQYDKFIEELYAAGLEQWIDSYTKQYQAMQ